MRMPVGCGGERADSAAQQGGKRREVTAEGCESVCVCDDVKATSRSLEQYTVVVALAVCPLLLDRSHMPAFGLVGCCTHLS